MRYDTKLRALISGDQHFGIRETKRLYEEFTTIFIPYLREKKDEIDVVFLTGDWFDSEISGQNIYYATQALAEIMAICEENNIKVRYIKGTYSHEYNQPSIFLSAFQTSMPNLDLKYFDTVTEETIDGRNILYIPEEYIVDPDKYYSKYRTSQYDLILGHGAWKYALGINAETNNNSDQKTAPTLIENDWMSALEYGVCVFSHIHNAPSYRNKIFYTKSFTSWRFDDKNPKGFIDLTLSEERGDYEINPIVNTLAPTFYKQKLEDILGFSSDTKDITEIRKLIKDTIVPREYRQIDLSNLSGTEINVLVKAFENVKEVKFSIDKKEILLKEDFDDEDKTLISENEYIFKASELGLDISDVISKYIEKTKEKKISVQRITELISE